MLVCAGWENIEREARARSKTNKKAEIMCEGDDDDQMDYAGNFEMTWHIFIGKTSP